MGESELHALRIGGERDPVTISAYVEDGFAFQLVRHYEDIDRPRSKQQDRHLVLVVFQKDDSEELSRDEGMLEQQLGENEKIWYPLYVHNVNNYEEIDKEEVLDEKSSDHSLELRFIQLEAGPFTLNVAKLRSRFDIISIEFETDEKGRPATEDMIKRWKREREKQRRKDQKSFEAQFGISSYTELPGEGS